MVNYPYAYSPLDYIFTINNECVTTYESDGYLLFTDINLENYVCPTVVDSTNWNSTRITSDTSSASFTIQQNGMTLNITRTDASQNWCMILRFRCTSKGHFQNRSSFVLGFFSWIFTSNGSKLTSTFFLTLSMVKWSTSIFVRGQFTTSSKFPVVQMVYTLQNQTFSKLEIPMTQPHLHHLWLHINRIANFILAQIFKWRFDIIDKSPSRLPRITHIFPRITHIFVVRHTIRGVYREIAQFRRTFLVKLISACDRQKSLLKTKRQSQN